MIHTIQNIYINTEIIREYIYYYIILYKYIFMFCIIQNIYINIGIVRKYIYY